MTIRLFCRPRDIEDKAFFTAFFIMASVIFSLGLIMIFSDPMDKGVAIPVKIGGVLICLVSYPLYYLSFSLININIYPFGWKKCKD